MFDCIYTGTRLIFVRNPCLMSHEALCNALKVFLTVEFKVFSSEDDFTHVANAKISSTKKATITSQRMWKIYQKLQDEFFTVQMSIFRIGSQAHSLNALVVDYCSLSARGVVCPTFSEVVASLIRNRTSLLAISTVKLASSFACMMPSLTFDLSRRAGATTIPQVASGTERDSCFNRLNSECSTALALVLRAMTILDASEKTSFDWEGIEKTIPENSTIPLSEILNRVHDEVAKGDNKTDKDFDGIRTCQTDFYKILAGQEAHIFLGSLRSRSSNGSFLFNPCSGASGDEKYKLEDFFGLANDSYLFGAVLKAAFLILLHGVQATTADSIRAMVLQDVIYPSLKSFVNFFQDNHFSPVSQFKFFNEYLIMFPLSSGLDEVCRIENRISRQLFFTWLESAITKMNRRQKKRQKNPLPLPCSVLLMHALMNVSLMKSVKISAMFVTWIYLNSREARYAVRKRFTVHANVLAGQKPPKE